MILVQKVVRIAQMGKQNHTSREFVVVAAPAEAVSCSQHMRWIADQDGVEDPDVVKGQRTG
jgi:hypothetical protein